MVEKYIIEKCDIHYLLTGQDIPLSQGRARTFCVEIAGKITNGDVIKSIFPHYELKLTWRNMATVNEGRVDMWICDKYSLDEQTKELQKQLEEYMEGK